MQKGFQPFDSLGSLGAAYGGSFEIVTKEPSTNCSFSLYECYSRKTLTSPLSANTVIPSGGLGRRGARYNCEPTHLIILLQIGPLELASEEPRSFDCGKASATPRPTALPFWIIWPRLASVYPFLSPNGSNSAVQPAGPYSNATEQPSLVRCAKPSYILAFAPLR